MGDDENVRLMETGLEYEEREIICIDEDGDECLVDAEAECYKEYREKDKFDYLDELDELEEMTSPRLSYWFDADGKKHQEIMVIINDVSNNYKNKLKMIEPCPICYLPFSTLRNHLSCCLPCGHMYGYSCIAKWLQIKSKRTCPQCNTIYEYNEVKPVDARFATAHLKTSSTRHFPFTKRGLNAFKEHERLRRLEAKKMYSKDHKRLLDVLEHRRKLPERWVALSTQVDDLSKGDEESERDYAFRRHGLKRRCNALRRQYDALGRRAAVLEQRTDVLERWLSAYKPAMKYLIQMYKEHFALQKNTKPCVAVAAAALLHLSNNSS